jgi:hypothetical protein
MRDALKWHGTKVMQHLLLGGSWPDMAAWHGMAWQLPICVKNPPIVDHFLGKAIDFHSYVSLLG